MNTEFKGTPGPWEFVPAAAHKDEDGSLDMGGFRSAKGWVCSFGDAMTYYPSEGSPPDPEDAYLIAAAPELLEALDELVSVLHQSGMYDDEVFSKALAAIAKALGQEE